MAWALLRQARELDPRTPSYAMAHIKHVGIILDGNGRWAKQKGLSRSEGHRAGYEVVMSLVHAARTWGVSHLTLYALSTQNLERPKSEVDRLLDLALEFLERQEAEVLMMGIRVRCIGDVSRLPDHLRASVERLMKVTASHTAMDLCLALIYDGKESIVRAVKEASRCGVSMDNLTVEDIDKHLETHPLGPVDLLIRTGEEQRLSGFLLWESSYAELRFTNTLFPDFTPQELVAILDEASGRERRFGKTSEQINARTSPARIERSEAAAASPQASMPLPRPAAHPAEATAGGGVAMSEQQQAALSTTRLTTEKTHFPSLAEMLEASDEQVREFCAVHGISSTYLPIDGTRRMFVIQSQDEIPRTEEEFLNAYMSLCVDQAFRLMRTLFDLGLRTVVILFADDVGIARGNRYAQKTLDNFIRELSSNPDILGFVRSYQPRVFFSGHTEALARYNANAPQLFSEIQRATAESKSGRTAVFHSFLDPASNYQLIADAALALAARGEAITRESLVQHVYGTPLSPIDFTIFFGPPRNHPMPQLLEDRSARFYSATPTFGLTREQIVTAIYYTALGRATPFDDYKDYTAMSGAQRESLRERYTRSTHQGLLGSALYQEEYDFSRAMGWKKDP